MNWNPDGTPQANPTHAKYNPGGDTFPGCTAPVNFSFADTLNTRIQVSINFLK